MEFSKCGARKRAVSSRLLRVLAMIGVFVPALASAVVTNYFPRATSGIPDISSPAAWGGTLPGVDDIVVFTGLTQTVTANADVEFGTLRNRLRAGYSDTLTFDLRNVSPVPTLKFKGFQPGTLASVNNFTTFRGGIVDFKGSGFAQGGDTYYGNGRYYNFCDGVVVTNISNMVLGYTAQNRLRIELSGRSKVYVGGIFRFTNNKTARGDENWLKITDGSLFQVAGGFNWEEDVASWSSSTSQQKDGNFFFKDLVEVSGEGSELVLLKPSNTNYQYPCGRQGGSKLVVTSNGTMRVKSAGIFWTHCTRNNLIQVSEGGLLQVSGAFHGGWGNVEGGDRSNRVEVLSGGTLSVGGSVFLGYSSGTAGNIGNTLLVSNGTFRCNGLVPGYCESTALSSVAESASNQLVVIQGSAAVFNPGDTFAMFRAPFCEYRVELGATFNPRPCSSFGYYNANRHDCVVRARRGGIFEFGEFSTTHQNSAAEDDATALKTVVGWNNRVIAEAGGIVTGKFLKVQGRACALRVDDSTVVLTNATTSLAIGYSNKYGGMGTNCVLEIAGERPAVRLSGHLSVNTDSRIAFELPAGGYAAGATPIVAEGNVTVDGTSRISFVGAEEMFAAHQAAHVRADYVLIENPSAKSFLTDAQVVAMQTELGSDFKVFKQVVGGRNQLVLRVKAARRGTHLLIH